MGVIFVHGYRSEENSQHPGVCPLEEIIEYISKPYEILLDQYAGSGNFVIACYNKNRNGIAIEKDTEMFEKMKNNIEKSLEKKFENIEEIEYEY